MYYKITNKKSQVWKKLFALRIAELHIEEENIKAIQAKTGLTWKTFLGHPGQQNYQRVSRFNGFKFLEDSGKIDSKIWILDKHEPGIYVPNRRTKAGREMSQFLANGLRSSSCIEVFDILKLKIDGWFSFPFVEICGETVILFLGDNLDINDTDIIEITRTEFRELHGSQS